MSPTHFCFAHVQQLKLELDMLVVRQVYCSDGLQTACIANWSSLGPCMYSAGCFTLILTGQSWEAPASWIYPTTWDELWPTWVNTINQL